MEYETLPPMTGRLTASTPRKGHGIFQNESVLIQDPDKLDKMEKTIAELTKKVVDLQQIGNQTMGAQDLANIMETTMDRCRGIMLYKSLDLFFSTLLLRLPQILNPEQQNLLSFVLGQPFNSD